MGVASRREAESWIQARKISVNGKVVTELGTKIDPTSDQIQIDGKSLNASLPPRVYWLLHKPRKFLTSRVGTGWQQTIYQLPCLAKVPFLVSPVGRLDYDTEGLLLLSNDGELVFRLSHPRFEIARQYHVYVDRRLTDEDEAKIRAGFDLDDGPLPKVTLQYAQQQKNGSKVGYWYFVTVREGRNRLVRRIFEALNYRVVRLVRFGFGDLRLPDTLAPGEYIQLDSDQIRSLKSAVRFTEDAVTQ